MKAKNYSIEFYRIIATLVICVHHMQLKCGLHIFTHGDLFVDFFFMVSGLFLARTFFFEKMHSGTNYFFKRIKRLYPEYLLAAILAIVSYGYAGKFSLSKAIPELLMVQNLGMFEGGYNYPCWYLSVLVFASFIIYQCIRYGKDIFIKAIAPVIIICGYGYISVNLNNPNFIWETSGAVHIPLLRCFCGLLTGVLIFYASKCDFVKNIKGSFATVIEVICITIIIAGILTEFISIPLTVFSMTGLIFITFTQKGVFSTKVFNHKALSKISNYSYSVYLCHGIFANTLDILNQSVFHLGKPMIIVYLVAVIAYAVISHHVVEFIVKKIDKKNKLAKA